MVSGKLRKRSWGGDVLKNVKMNINLGKEARKLVESQYAWNIIGKKLQNAYESVLASARKKELTSVK